MYILLAISILSFFALLLAAVAIARHVRIRRVSNEPQPDFAQHLFAAAEDQDSLAPRAVQQQSAKNVMGKTNWNSAFDPTLANTLNQSISSKRL
jgi:hypothetical protein